MIALLFLSVFPAALVIAAATDLYDFKIPNWVSLTLVGAYACAGVFLGAPIAQMVEGALLGCAVLAVGFVLFAVRFFGGGDAKLLAAVAPWIGLAEFVNFLMAMALAGGALAIVLIAFRKTPPLPVYAHAGWLMRMHQNRHELPYAVAISCAGLMTFRETPFFQIAFGG
ncbi:MAG: prepilin peptidase [Pseudomonadota bacterium]